MKRRRVLIEQQGEKIVAGELRGETSRDTVFVYASTYLDRKTAASISLCLPLQEEPFSPEATRFFFEGLLPEGFIRKSLASQIQIEANDYLPFLELLGRECLGAIQILGEDEEQTPAAYEPLQLQQVKDLAAEGATETIQWLMRAHLSLTGASGKMGLYYDEKEDRWYLPVGSAPSTHIVKQSHIRYDSIVTNEQLSLRTAFHLGIPVVESFIVNTGEGEDRDVLFATRRYDRVIPEGGERLQGLPVPLRLHQEDLIQAMGIAPEKKYEPLGASYLRDAFSLIRAQSSAPIEDQQMLWDRIVFYYLIGNTDGHLKNSSLLYGSDLRTIRLAPAYDILCTTIYPEHSREMAFHIGGEKDIDQIDAACFRRAASEAGLREAGALERLEELKEKFPAALTQAAEELYAHGFAKAIELKQRIETVRQGK